LLGSAPCNGAWAKSAVSGTTGYNNRLRQSFVDVSATTQCANFVSIYTFSEASCVLIG